MPCPRGLKFVWPFIITMGPIITPKVDQKGSMIFELETTASLAKFRWAYSDMDDDV